MPFASVLTLIRPDQPDSALEGAIGFAGDGHLMVLVAAKAPPAPVSAYDMTSGTAWLEATEEARRWAAESADAVEALLARRDQRGAVSGHVAGPVHLSDLVASASRCADIVLMPVGAARDQELEHAVVNGAMFETGAPVLVYPAATTPASTPKNVLVAWKATPESGRALRLALPVLKTAASVTVLLIDPEPGARGHGEEPGADIATYLAHHGIRPEVVKLPSEGRTAEEDITRQVRETGADMLVMGAYGHSRLRQRIFGGTTQAILDAPPCPVFFAH
ncbi:universal stress protein [Halovulum dunhuangense]|uniref:Universal stress protein n=1 Tax=Halovulum dunhuangense TaxID=1505036 RepID=A0A849L4T9_9RHOB|nr:universal stress protein [Halovulum dunhuangense]NNU81161.1 universal stress protein [Halovulum dunhuangense]